MLARSRLASTSLALLLAGSGCALFSEPPAAVYRIAVSGAS